MNNMEYTKKDTYRKRGRKNKRDKIEKKNCYRSYKLV